MPVLGQQWSDAGRACSDSLPAYCALFTVSPLSRALLLTKRMELKFVADLAALLLPLVAMKAFSTSGLWIALSAFMVASVAACAIYLGLILYATSLEDVAAPAS